MLELPRVDDDWNLGFTVDVPAEWDLMPIALPTIPSLSVKPEDPAIAEGTALAITRVVSVNQGTVDSFEEARRDGEPFVLANYPNAEGWRVTPDSNTVEISAVIGEEIVQFNFIDGNDTGLLDVAEEIASSYFATGS